jgi:hypothetical protein
MLQSYMGIQVAACILQKQWPAEEAFNGWVGCRPPQKVNWKTGEKKQLKKRGKRRYVSASFW